MLKYLYMKNKYTAEWYKAILDSMEDFVLVKGNKSKLLWANKPFLNYYGLSEDQLQNIIDSEHSDPDDTLQYVKDDAYVFKELKALRIESEPITKHDSSIAYYETIKSPVYKDGDFTNMSVGISRLNEKSHVIEKSIIERNSQKEFISFQREFILNLNIPALFLNAQGYIVAASKTFSSLFDVSEDYLHNKLANDFFETKSLDFASSHKEREIKNFLITIKEKSLIGYLTIAPWMIKKEEVGGSLVFFKDMTSEIQLKKQLEFEKKRSYLSDKMKSLGELSAGVGHEINNPLAIISGKIQKLQLLKGEELEKLGILDDLEVILQSSDRIGKIVKGLKSISRDSTKDDYIDRNIMSIINDTLSVSEGRLYSLSIKLIKDLTCDFNISCKPSQISQVLLNLISNAVDEIKESQSPWIKIATRSDENFNYIDFTDSGEGIPEDMRETIFDPFYTSKPVGQGTGLGLGICLEIINSHGGALYINDKYKNTTFTIRFKK